MSEDDDDVDVDDSIRPNRGTRGVNTTLPPSLFTPSLSHSLPLPLARSVYGCSLHLRHLGRRRRRRWPICYFVTGTAAATTAGVDEENCPKEEGDETWGLKVLLFLQRRSRRRLSPDGGGGKAKRKAKRQTMLMGQFCKSPPPPRSVVRISPSFSLYPSSHPLLFFSLRRRRRRRAEGNSRRLYDAVRCDRRGRRPDEPRGFG
jgi:hypothetical protein